jgi:hypothetical protein
MVSSARHTRPLPTHFHLAESEDPTIENRHMPEPPLSGSRKRRRLEPPQLNETSRSVSKKQRLSPPSGSQPPAAFWGGLSKIWLTKRALRELDRRNAQAVPSPPRSLQQARRPVTRNFLAELKRIAGDGGPDLSDLRNVCTIGYLPACAKANDAI